MVTAQRATARQTTTTMIVTSEDDDDDDGDGATGDEVDDDGDGAKKGYGATGYDDDDRWRRHDGIRSRQLW